MNENLPVSQFVEFDLNALELWDLISTPGNLNHAHPYCLSNEIISWDSDGHSDRIVYLNGRNYVRKFNTWEEKQGFNLQIGEENGPQSFVKWEISAISSKKTTLKITVYPYILSKFSRPLRKILHNFWVKPRLEKYLNSVLLGFLYYSENGSSVPKNHFGKHPWFS